MRFLEYETWRLKKDIDMEAYDKIIKDWLAFVVKNRQELFPEWGSAKQYRKTDRDGNPNGLFVMMFEYESLEGHHAYKERRKMCIRDRADIDKSFFLHIFQLAP